MALIKNGELVASSFVDVSTAEAIPLTGAVIVSLEQWQAQRAALLARGTPLGIRLHSDQSPDLVAADLAHFALVSLEFPKFRDGRAYSYARLLRERHGFKGELRAVGDGVGDQRHAVGDDVLVARRAPLEVRRQVDPQLDAVEEAARCARGIRAASRSGRFPLRRSSTAWRRR